MRLGRVGRFRAGYAKAVAACVAILLSGGLGATAASAAPTPTPTPAPTEETGPQVSVNISPSNMGIVQAGGTLTATVTIDNNGHGTLAAGTVAVSLDASAITSRAGLHTWLTSKDKKTAGTTVAQLPTPAIPAGQSRTLPLVTVPPTVVPLPAKGSTVRGLAAHLTVDGTGLATDRTTVISFASRVHAPSNVAFAMPLTTPPGSDGLISADTLDAYTGPNGVLTRELDGIEGNDRVAIGLDPRILASIRALGTDAPSSAAKWLKRLDLLPNDIFPLAYGDADVAAQAQSGLGTLLAPTSLEYGLDPSNFQSPVDEVGETPKPTASGTPTPTEGPTDTPTPTPTRPPNMPDFDELLAWPYTMSGIAWPADGTVRTADLPVFAASGLPTTILSSSNVETKGAALTSPVLPTQSGKALVADSALSEALRTAEVTETTDEWNAAMAAVAAQMALIDTHGDTARTILATLGRQSPTTSGRLRDTIGRFDSLPWTNPIPLTQAASAPALSDVTIKDSPEPGARIEAVKGLLTREAQIGSFATVVNDPALLTGRYRADMLALLSVAWRSPPNDWPGAVAESMNASQKTLTAVQVISPGPVNLLGNQASIPITISNKLKDLAVTVVLRTTPSNGRLEIDQDVTKTVEPDSRATALVPVNARVGNGRTTLTFQLYSKTGIPIGGTPTAPVNVRADWEGLIALIIGILVVALFGFGLVRNLVRRRRASRASGEAGGKDAGGNEAGDIVTDESRAGPGDKSPVDRADAAQDPLSDDHDGTGTTGEADEQNSAERHPDPDRVNRGDETPGRNVDEASDRDSAPEGERR